MLDVKKLLVKVLTVIKKSMYGSVTNVYWWSNTWTAPNDGMLVLRITPSSTPWYWYINDTAVNSMVGSWSHQYRGNYNGGTETYCIPVKKGATFSTAMINNINSIQCLYYPMTIGGGGTS